MQKAHSNIDWENYPSIDTPINEQNLNKMDKSIDTIDDRVIALDTTKFNVSDAQTLIKGISLNYSTGVLTITYYNGSTATINTGLAQVAVNLEFDEETQILYIVKADGSRQPVDLSAFITDYEFLDSDTVAFSVDTSGKVTATVKEGSIEEKHLRPDYLADIRVESAKAEKAASDSKKSANMSESFARGGTGLRENEEADNSKYYSERSKTEADRAKSEADRASDIVGIGIATTQKAGIVKPDGDTIEITEDGTIRASKAGNLSALTLPYNGTDDTETTKEVVDALKTEVSEKLDASDISQTLIDGDYSRILSYADLTGTVTGKFIFKDTQANANLALAEEKLPDGTIVIITDD